MAFPLSWHCGRAGHRNRRPIRTGLACAGPTGWSPPPGRAFRIRERCRLRRDDGPRRPTRCGCVRRDAHGYSCSNASTGVFQLFVMWVCVALRPAEAGEAPIPPATVSYHAQARRRKRVPSSEREIVDRAGTRGRDPVRSSLRKRAEQYIGDPLRCFHIAGAHCGGRTCVDHSALRRDHGDGPEHPRRVGDIVRTRHRNTYMAADSATRSLHSRGRLPGGPNR